MSSSYLVGLRPGEKCKNVAHFRNSWGTAAVVWDDFCVRYLGHESHVWLLPGLKQQALWDAWKDHRIPLSHRAVLLFTFDRAYVARKDYQRFAGDLRNYLVDLSVPSGYVNHWPKIAEFFEGRPDAISAVDYPAIGLHVTTVTANPFDGPYNEEKNDYDPFDWSTAFDLYTELDGLDRNPSLAGEQHDDVPCSPSADIE